MCSSEFDIVFVHVNEVVAQSDRASTPDMCLKSHHSFEPLCFYIPVISTVYFVGFYICSFFYSLLIYFKSEGGLASPNLNIFVPKYKYLFYFTLSISASHLPVDLGDD